LNPIIHTLSSILASAPGQSDTTFWLPPQRSTYAAEIDGIFNFILYLSVFFFALIIGLMVYFVIKYHAREGHEPQPSPKHNLALELTWTIIPLFLVLYIFYIGFRGYMTLSYPPLNAYDINVTAMQWKWMFTYPNGYVDENLHVPVDRSIRLTLTSEDVLHALFVPAFRMKMDVVPGRYHKMWFNATQAGEYDLYCAEYCGTQHSDMIAKAIVHPPGEFEKWLEQASNFLATLPPDKAGEKLYQVRGCKSCHSTDGKIVIGPTFKGFFGHEVALKDGSKVIAEENYIRESILNPQAKIVAGFQPVMPTFKGKLKDEEITAIIEYFKTLKE
jgi:cytochrome c oxidase subunit 2